MTHTFYYLLQHKSTKNVQDVQFIYNKQIFRRIGFIIPCNKLV